MRDRGARGSGVTRWQQRSLLAGCALLVALLASWVYWPGLAGPALLDDRSSVLVIGDLKEKPELARDYVLGNGSGPLGRPVSMASFVLEKLFLEDGLDTSKRVNVYLHMVNGALLMWLFVLLLRHLDVPGYPWLALLLATAWLLSPLYVSTVLYIVQRMAMLATTFMLLACICYVHWRQQLARGRFSIPLCLLVFINIVLGLLAKENAIVVVPVLLLLEALWFQFTDAQGRVIRWLQRLTLTAITLGAAIVALVLVFDYDSLAAAFRRRPFTLDERLLTESRIVWDYLGQLLLPDVARMGLYHDDIQISTSLYEPVSTLHAIVAWSLLVLAMLFALRWKWGRYLALGPAWFLVGHSVESTVISLELYFEHRNYFPGMGIFLLGGVLLAALIKKLPEVKAPLLTSLALPLIGLTGLTSSQVQIWSSHPLLMLSHLNAHPQSFRANADMAVQMANLGQIEAARRYSARAFGASTGERSGDRDIRDLALSCIANQPVAARQVDDLGTHNPQRPFGSVVTLLTLVRLLQDDACPEFDRIRFADRMSDIFLSENAVATASANMYLNLAILENALQRWDTALHYVDRYLQFHPRNARGLLMKLHFATALGKVGEAEGVRTLLQEKSSRGNLTVEEQQTLSLYLEL